MNDALTYIFYIFNKIIYFLFNKEFFSGVSIGWVFIVVSVFAIVIKSVLNLPSGLIFKNLKKEEKHE